MASLACGQSKKPGTISNLVIDPKIKQEAQKYIEDSNEFDAYQDKMQVYGNALFTDSYINDSLVLSAKDKENKQVFKSFYLWHGDTLSIEGAFGLFGGIGFVIDISKNNATLYHMLSSDDFPTFTFKEKDSLQDRLQVACTGTKIILSELPDSTKKQIIYGYVEFKSGEYYASTGSTNGLENPRNKQRDNMKIYFRSSKLNF
jgi:hypothetical protein